MTIARASTAASCRPCATRRRTRRRSATSCSCAAGYIRQVGAGLWTFTPLGWRVHRKVEQIIREELDAIGAQEWLAPVLTPAELWEATGRDRIPEIFHVEDRAGRRFVLPMTHEETFTFHARELQSYRQLPQSWYHFQTKDRDEPRPAQRPDPRPRVHHEGLVLVRPGRGRPGARASARTRRPITGSSSAAGSSTTRCRRSPG